MVSSKTVLNKKTATIIFVTFESEFTRFGGLGAVMSQLPNRMVKDTDQPPCLVMAPYFKHITCLPELKKKEKIAAFETLFSLNLPIGGEVYVIEVTEVQGTGGVITYLIGCDSFFTAPQNPYVNPCNASEPLDPYRNPVISDRLTEDALFFSAALPVVLAELHREKKINTPQVILHLQDWETAPVAKALKVYPTAPQIQSIKCVLTMHNPYDRPFSPLDSVKAQTLRRYLQLEESTVLEQCLPLMAGPVSTVSKNFAHELTNESLHTHVFASHLQTAIIDRGIVGIDNGLFGKSQWPFSEQAQKEGKKGRYSAIVEEKQVRRAELAKLLKRYQADLKKEYPTAKAAEKAGIQWWGSELDLSDPSLPVFMVMGRDDPRQKGYDVIVEAIRALPKNQARFIFTPNPGDEGLVGLSFLKSLTEDRPQEAIALPYHLSGEIFMAIQRGSSYMVMGSLYEPFGAATEAYIAGMPVVARATGGLVQQVAYYPCSNQVLSQYGQYLSGRYHRENEPPTGILFREKWLSEQAQHAGWRNIVDCSYWNENPKGDRVANRKGVLLFDEMVKSAAAALQLAIEIYQSKPEAYGAMIYHGFQSLKHFSWEKAISEYQKYLY